LQAVENNEDTDEPLADDIEPQNDDFPEEPAGIFIKKTSVQLDF